MAMAMAAMTEDGTNDSRETSPDPIVLPSSPLSGRKLRTTRKRASTPRKSRLSQQQTRATPSKEIILDTPQLGITNDGSPWRIKVTVQAEQRDSPGKMVTRTTSIPLMNSPSQRKRSASPVKRRKATPKKTAQQQQDGDEELVEVKKRGRKRKGTPLKEKRSAPQLRARQSVEEVPQHDPEVEPEEQQDDQDQDVYGEAAALEAEQAMQVLDSESHTPPNHRRASGRLARLNAQYSDGTGRTKRLSRAREELDEALQDAVGDGYGDLTLSRAEDFTMVSLESLQTTKEASLLHNSQLSRSHLSTVREGEGEKSALSVSYLPSSPPKGQAIPQYPDLSAVKAQTTVLSPWQPSIKHLTAQTTLQSPFEPTSSTKKKKSMLRQSIDAISWKPALLSATKASSSKLHRSQPVLQTPLDQSTNVSDEARSQWQREREAVSQQIQQASPENVVTVDDDEHMSDAEDEGEDDAGGDGDVWQTEASRELERPDTTSTEDRPLDSQRPERVEDLFAHLPLKPARPKIPRTWRRSSGMDFSYIDSPAHLPLAEPANDRRHSTDGSGVLTPPSTDQSEEEEDFEETAGTVDLQGGADDQLQSEFTQPETEGTRYQDEDSDDQMLDNGDMEDELHQDDEQAQNSEDDFEIVNHEGKPPAPRTNVNRDDEYVPSRNDSKSPLSEAGSPDEADKAIARSMLPPSSRSTRSSQKRGSAFERGIMNGSFPSDVDFEPTRQRRSRSQAQKSSTASPDHAAAVNTMSQVTNNKDKPRRRPPRRPTADLADLLGLASSPVKPVPKEVRVSEVGKPAQHLRSVSSSAQKKSSPLSARHMDKIRKDSPSGGATKQKLPNVAARNNLLNGSNITGSAQQTSDEDELARPLPLERPAPSAQAMFLSPPKLTHDPITGKLLPQPKRRGRRRKVGDEGQTESTVTDSFASKESEPTQRTESQLDTSMADSFTSKTSDQRQLLQESAVKKKMPPPAATNWSRELQSSAIKRKELHLQRQAEELAAAAAEANRQSTGVENRDHAQPQRRQMQVTYPDDEQDDLQADEQEEQRIRGHRRIISAVDSNTEMPDDEGTHAQMQDVSYSGERTYEDESTAQPDHLRSYEENLNLDSPTKIRVNFNDTMSFSKDVDQTSSWLAEPRRRPTLFDTNAAAQRPLQPQPGSGTRPLSVHAPELTLADKQQAQVSGTGLFSKLSTTLWNAVVRPSGPTEVYPDLDAQVHAQPQVQARTSAPAPVIQQLQNLGDDSFTLTLRSQLRGRYGVLSERFPWTMAHQRTLHRMLNSVCSGRPDTLIPRKGRLPRELEKSINEICTSVTGYKWVFTKDQAYIVHSFMHTLVAEDLVTDMRNGEVEFIGDETAMLIRGYLDPDRHGNDHVWTLERGHPKNVVGYVDKQKGKILLNFVIKALGDCVLSNEVLRQRLVKEGREEDFERIAYGIEVR